MAISQLQSLKQTQKLTTKQIQLFNIIALPTVELEQYITNEMAINPALEFDNEIEQLDEFQEIELGEAEVDDFGDDKISEGVLGEDYDYTDYMDKDSLDDYKLEVNNSSADDDKKETVIVGNSNFTEFLVSQLNLLPISQKEKEIGEHIIESLDDDGYLRATLADLADEISFKNGLFVQEVEIKLVLNHIQSFEPRGIGAQNLQECLLLQLKLKSLKTKETYHAISILENCMDDLVAKKFDRIKKHLKLDDDELNDAVSEIKSLNPKPASTSSDSTSVSTAIVPDFTVNINDGEVDLYLNQYKQPALKISTDYTEMLGEYSKSKNKELREASSFIKDKVENAKWFIEALQQRESMMILVAKAIVNHQKKYFLTGDRNDLRPMILKDVALTIGADISMISRIANSKYINTSFGTILIKDLFVQGIANEQGDMVSTNELKQEIINIINTEDKCNPYTDDEIVKLLAAKKCVISRRTVGKYRDEMSIPNKSLRKAA